MGYKIGEREFELTDYNLANADKCADFVDHISKVFYENGSLGQAILKNQERVLRFLSAVLTPKDKKWSLDIYQENYDYFNNNEIPMSVILGVIVDFFTNNISLMQSLRFPTITQKIASKMIQETIKETTAK